MTVVNRGEIYKILFPYTFDPRYPQGKQKYAVILQGGSLFERHNTVVILLTTTNSEAAHLDYVVEIEKGTTRLPQTSYVDCSQLYTVQKKLFNNNGSRFMGVLSDSKLEEIDEAMYLGLCMGEPSNNPAPHSGR